MRRLVISVVVAAVAMLAFAARSAWAANVKITPLGLIAGEFCKFDRAMVCEDPDGTRILYDAGRSVRGPNDPRLGRIDAVLPSHAHGDHPGDKHQAGANAGTCGNPALTVIAAPNSNSVNIVMAKKAKFIVGGEMAGFFANKIKSPGGNPKLVQLLR